MEKKDYKDEDWGVKIEGCEYCRLTDNGYSTDDNKPLIWLENLSLGGCKYHPKACIYLSRTTIGAAPGTFNFSIWLREFDGQGLVSDQIDVVCEDLAFKYCPMCGREL